MLSAVLLTAALAAGLGLVVAAASGDGSYACGAAYADSLQANRRRLAGIDHLLSRYDLSQADDPLVMLRKAQRDVEFQNPFDGNFERARARARARERAALGDETLAEKIARLEAQHAAPKGDETLAEKMARVRLELKGVPPYSPDNPYTERARVFASLDAMKRQGADSNDVDNYLRRNEQLSPSDTTIPMKPRRSMEGIVAAVETRMVDSIWYDTAYLARSASVSSGQCFKSRAGLAVSLPALIALITLLFAVWWSWFGGRTTKPETTQ